jgi:hypothetical protein
MSRDGTAEGEDWFEVSVRDWLDPRFVGKKLKLLADADVPKPIVDELNAANVVVKTLANLDRRRDDQGVLDIATREGLVLLTLDRDFWDDRKHPIHFVRRGIVFVDEPPQEYDRVLRAFGLLYGCFASSYPLDWWNTMKARCVVEEFEIKMRTRKGTVERHKFRLRAGRLYAKEIL